MKRTYRALGAITIVSILVFAALILPNSSLLAGKTDNPTLNKAAVTADTPYIVLGMGCFWGAEKRIQALVGVLDVEAGYADGDVLNPSYQTLHETELAKQNNSAIKNHAEVVKVYYDPRQTTLENVLIQFWESHNPTQVNRQGNDIGSNYRSAVFYQTPEEQELAEKTRAIYQANLKSAGINQPIVTEISPLKNYTPAENYHQDYLEKNPLGYCGLGGTSVAYVDPSKPINSENTHSTQLSKIPVNSNSLWKDIKLNSHEQLIAFEAIDCGYCRLFDKDVLSSWNNALPIVSSNATSPPEGWTLKQVLFATPTIVLFIDQHEVARYTGYQGAERFWKWLKDETQQL